MAASDGVISTKKEVLQSICVEMQEWMREAI